MDCRVKPGNDECDGRQQSLLVIPGLDPSIHSEAQHFSAGVVEHHPSHKQKTTSRTPIRDPGRQRKPYLLPWAPDQVRGVGCELFLD